MSGRLDRFREEFRQRGHHRAFRIPPAPDPSLQEILRNLLTIVEEVGPPPGSTTTDDQDAVGRGADEDASDERAAGDNARPEQADGGLDEAILADAVTNLWRAQRRMDRAGKEAAAHVRHPARFLRTCSTLLADGGLVVQDHDGDRFNPGHSLEVLAFQEDASLAGETVLETVRPTIYLHGRRIQMGQVIIGHPPGTAADEPESEAEGPESEETNE